MMEIICKQWTEPFNIYDYRIDDILSLIKEAYGERAKEGITYASLNSTIDDFIAERTDDSYWFLAFDNEHHLYGTARLNLKGNFGVICNFAVFPNFQGKHIGSQLLQAANRFAKEEKLDYIISHTAMKATSSVRCHCNNGFKIVGIGCNIKKRYSSFVFRNQLSYSFLWSSSIWIRLRYMVAYVKYRLLKRLDGSNTIIANLILYVKKTGNCNITH